MGLSIGSRFRPVCTPALGAPKFKPLGWYGCLLVPALGHPKVKPLGRYGYSFLIYNNFSARLRSPQGLSPLGGMAYIFTPALGASTFNPVEWDGTSA